LAASRPLVSQGTLNERGGEEGRTKRMAVKDSAAGTLALLDV